MKATNPILVHKLLCSLLLFSFYTLTAQIIPERLIQDAEKSQNLESVKVSGNTHYSMVRLTHAHNRDTLLVFNNVDGVTMGFRTKVGESYFIGSDAILLPGKGKTELWNLKNKSAVLFDHTQKVKDMKGGNLFIIHYDAIKSDRLILYDQNGKPLQQLDGVQSFFVLSNSEVAAVTTRNQELYIISTIGKRKVYSIGHTIENVEKGYKDDELLIWERAAGSAFQEILCLNGSKIFRLADVLSVPFNNGFLEKVGTPNGYFLRISSQPSPNEGIVDVWYGNDTHLQDKYLSPGDEQVYLWYPTEKKVQKVSNQNFRKLISLGNVKQVLAFNPDQLQDYTTVFPTVELNVIDIDTGTSRILDTFSTDIYVSNDGKFFLSYKNDKWCLYGIDNNSMSCFGSKELLKPFFTKDGKGIIFEGENGLWFFNIAKGKLTTLLSTPGYTATLVNGTSKAVANHGMYQNSVDNGGPLLIRLFDSEKAMTSFIKWYKGKEIVIVPPSRHLYSEMHYDPEINRLIYLEQDYNLPPRLVTKGNGIPEHVLFQSNKNDTSLGRIRQEIISYPDGQGNPIQGVLFYPVNFKEAGTFPMVVHIYENQRHRKNLYLNLSYNNGIGFNPRVFLENGYFVFFPDIAYGNSGSGLSALQCVTNALDVLRNEEYIDQRKVGLIGHSFGGYETNFIATQSDRFAAYVSGAGNSDIVNTYHTFNTNFLSPSFWRFESFQYRMYKPFSEDKELYFKNNPLYNADKVNAPVLLWTGLKDENIKWEESRTFYNALRRNDKKVVALFYRGEDHSLQGSAAQQDLSIRILNWFDYFLKGQNDIAWIDREMEKGAE
ncbi:MAG: alpha/beta hydrolase family protein [Bacteroidia bacterium]